MNMTALAYVVFGLCVASAWLYTRRDRSYVGASATLTAGLAIDLLRSQLHHPRSLECFLVSEGLYVAWSFLVVNLLLVHVWHLFRWSALPAWFCFVAVAALRWPVDQTSLEELHRLLHGLVAATFVVSLLRSVVMERVTTVVLAALILGATELLLVIGPYALLPGSVKQWDLARWIYVAAFVVLTLLHGAKLCNHPHQTSQPKS